MMAHTLYVLLLVAATMSLCWAQAPGDEETRCTVQHSSPPTYPDTERNLMDSYNYEDLVPGNGTGSIIATAVWNDYSFDGNDADGIVAPTYWQQLAGGLCRFQARVCGWRQNGVVVPQDNWLFTQHIRQDFDSTTYDYNVTIHVFASYSGPNCRERNGCRQRFNLLHYFTNTPQLPSTEGTGYMNRENYQRFAEPTTLVTTSMNTYSFTLSPSFTGFYIAVQDIGSCLTLSRLRVYRNNCKSRQVGLVQYPSAPSPIQPANIFTTCVANADHVESRIVTCTSHGTWGPETPVCQCRLGYEYRETECVACSAGEYRSSRDSVCQRCPDNTVMTEVAAPECQCKCGYFRNNVSNSDTRHFENPRDETPDFDCTKPPGPPERVSLTPQRTGMIVSWSPPTDDGGRTDDYYYVEISDPDNLGSYRDGQYHSGTSRCTSFSGLRRCTQYCVRVTAHNGVSDQDPDRFNARTVEVCEETRRDRPDKVTGVQGTQPYVVWSPTPCSDGYRITFSKSGGTIRRNVTSEYYIVRSSDVPEGSGVLSVTVAAFNDAGFGAESDTFQLSTFCDASDRRKPINIVNVFKVGCGHIQWDPSTVDGCTDNIRYRIRIFSGDSFKETSRSQRVVLSSTTNSLTFSSSQVPSTRPLRAIVKAMRGNGLLSQNWSGPIVISESFDC